MGFFDSMITGTKNLANRDVKLSVAQGGFLITIMEHGYERSRLLSKKGIEDLQEALWDNSLVRNGIVMSFPPSPNEVSAKFEIPPWAMSRLQKDFFNNRIHLHVTQ